MAKRWFYSGDVNIEHGGFFYELSTFYQGYVNVVRCQPCSDAGGPDNVFWVERLSVIIHEPEGVTDAFGGVGATLEERNADRILHGAKIPERTESALQCCGWDHKLDEWAKLTHKQREHVIVDACLAYGHYDKEDGWTVQVGPQPEGGNPNEGPFDVTNTLRSNASLRKWVRAKCS